MRVAPVNLAGSGDNTVIAAPPANKFLRIHGYVLTAGGTVNVFLKDGAGGQYSGPLQLSTNGGVSAPIGFPSGWLDLPPGTSFVLNLSSSVQLGGHIAYEVVG